MAGDRASFINFKERGICGMSRKEELYAVCPLLVPQDRNEMTYDGFIKIYVSFAALLRLQNLIDCLELLWFSVQDQTYRLCIARENTDSLKSIR